MPCSARKERARDEARSVRVAGLVLIFLLVSTGGCDDHHHHHVELGPPTETVCPPAGTDLTCANFGQPFMGAYCLGCHSVEVTGADRHGAPSDHNFDTQFEALALRDHIDRMAGAGPAAVNTQMPPDHVAAPTLEERESLSEWLA